MDTTEFLIQAQAADGTWLCTHLDQEGGGYNLRTSDPAEVVRLTGSPATGNYLDDNEDVHFAPIARWHVIHPNGWCENCRANYRKCTGR